MKSALKPIIRVWCTLDKSNQSFKHGSVRFIHAATDSTKGVRGTDLIPVNETAIKDKLKEFSVPYTDGYTCFHIKNCSVCSPKSCNTSSNPDIFINKKTGFFLCKNCKITGNWFTFKGLLNKSKLGKKNSEVAQLKNDCPRYDKDSNNWKTITENTSLLNELPDKAYENVFKKFNLTRCSKKAVEKLQVRISKNDVLYLPLHSSESNIVGYKSLDANGQSNTLPKTDCPGFIYYPNKNSSVVVVAQIHDFFALVSQKLPYQVLCLPYGVSNLPQSALPFLESFDKIILWLGNTGPLDSTGNFAKKLNDKRCYVIRPIENQTSALTALQNNENIISILNDAKPTWHEYITTFNSLREEVLSQLQNRQVTVGVQWSRFPKLNEILKGHRRGELTVLTGPTGAGKTTFISEYSLDLAMQGVNTLWGSFEIKNSRLVKMMLQQYLGSPLPTGEKEFNQVADKFEQLPLFFMTFHGQQPLSTVMDAVEHCSYTYDIAHVIIDNVQFMIEVSPDSFQIDRFWKQDCLIQSFRSFATKNNCHVTLVMHPKKGMDGADLSINSIFGGAKAAQEADNIFIIQNKRMSFQGGRKFLQVSKNRFSGDQGAMPLNFDKTTLSFAIKKPECENEKDSTSSKPVPSEKTIFKGHFESHPV